jgi:hypothetical protein
MSWSKDKQLARKKLDEKLEEIFDPLNKVIVECQTIIDNPEAYPVDLLILLKMSIVLAEEVKKNRDRVQQGPAKAGRAAPKSSKRQGPGPHTAGRPGHPG